MSSVPKHDRCSAGESPEGKSRGNRLARRARSFKEDFLGILSQMRSPGGSGTRSGSRAGSPSSPRQRCPPTDHPPAVDLESHVRQAQLALKHFRDVVSKNKLEMIPGNGTVVLETVTAIHVLLKKYLANEQSATLLSATNHVYQCVAKLIRLCDDYLLIGDKVLDNENVSEILQHVDDAIQNLVGLGKDKLAMRETCLRLSTDSARDSIKSRTLNTALDNSSSQRSSLPDIPLTPREREMLEQTSARVLDRHSHSSENVLKDAPPPKPPHPDRGSVDGFPPPLPPKKRHRQDICGGLKTSLENLSFRSKSPGDSSSLFSESAGSMDSMLNHSRDDELRHLLDDNTNAVFTHSSSHWDSSSSTSTEHKSSDHSIAIENSVTQLDRLSGSQAESGFSSFQSVSGCSQQRSSTSTRSSQISHISQESSHLAERRCFKEIMNGNNSSELCNSSKIITNGVSTVSKQTSTSSSLYSSRPTGDCSSCVNSWIDGLEVADVISYCPTHRAEASPVSSRLTNPLEDGWTLFSSPSQEDDSPPALPEKTKKRERHPSQYDNVPDSTLISSLSVSEHHSMSCRTETNTVGDEVDSRHVILENNSSEMLAALLNNQVISSSSKEHVQGCVIESKTVGGICDETIFRSGFSSIETTNSCCSDGMPPPLPMKKKHMFQSVAYSVMAYMEMFGNASHGNTSEFLRHSVHVYQHPADISPNFNANLSPHSLKAAHHSLDPRALRAALPPALPPKRNRISSTRSSTTSPPLTPVHTTDPDPNQRFVEISCPSLSPVPVGEQSPSSTSTTENDEVNILELMDATPYLVFKKAEDDGPDIRGGHPDGLLIHATKAQKNDFLYQEAFLTTYRTFISPIDLIHKLCWRYDRLSSFHDSAKQRAAREGFSLLVRVVSDLTLSDVDDNLMKKLMDFVQSLLCRGDLAMAKALRVVMLAKYEAKRFQVLAHNSLPTHQTSIRQTTLLDLKSEQVAEQMTLLDAELFLKIEIPEVLIWAQEQNEERSPNLTRFTEHFNKMSYWARSRILEQNDSREREKYVVKFIKIMKHLRKINNFNSYLALLSALDSAPIRRLEWPKHITEGLKEYCALIDSSSSFRAYRQALADTQPPCIPYIGIVLQDLTFVHIGNINLLPDGGINFSKRWQQFNIVENMKKFKKGSYLFKKNERIISFFNGFDESLSEEAMWQISEKIKPRGGKKL